MAHMLRKSIPEQKFKNSMQYKARLQEQLNRSKQPTKTIQSLEKKIKENETIEIHLPIQSTKTAGYPSNKKKKNYKTKEEKEGGTKKKRRRRKM